MKNIFSILLILLLLSFTSAHSEVYSWIDKDGKKNFGEHVPQEYMDKRTEVHINPVNSIGSTNGVDTSNLFSTPEESSESEQAEPEVVELTKKMSDCEQRKLAYEESAKCYLGCRRISGDKEHRIYNVANCSHCTDVKNPNCD